MLSEFPVLRHQSRQQLLDHLLGKIPVEHEEKIDYYRAWLEEVLPEKADWVFSTNHFVETAKKGGLVDAMLLSNDLLMGITINVDGIESLVLPIRQLTSFSLDVAESFVTFTARIETGAGAWSFRAPSTPTMVRELVAFRAALLQVHV